MYRTCELNCLAACPQHAAKQTLLQHLQLDVLEAHLHRPARVDLQAEEDTHKSSKRIRLGILIGMLFVLFVASLRFAVSSAGISAAALSAVAIGAGFALFWFVSRFE